MSEVACPKEATENSSLLSCFSCSCRSSLCREFIVQACLNYFGNLKIDEYQPDREEEGRRSLNPRCSWRSFSFFQFSRREPIAQRRLSSARTKVKIWKQELEQSQGGGRESSTKRKDMWHCVANILLSRERFAEWPVRDSESYKISFFWRNRNRKTKMLKANKKSKTSCMWNKLWKRLASGAYMLAIWVKPHNVSWYFNKPSQRRINKVKRRSFLRLKHTKEQQEEQIQRLLVHETNAKTLETTQSPKSKIANRATKWSSFSLQPSKTSPICLGSIWKMISSANTVRLDKVKKNSAITTARGHS